MKTHFNNRELAHVYLNQTDAELDSGRDGYGSNFRFTGPALYSYATQIAHIYRNKDGARLVLIDSHSFSNSTQKQKGGLWRGMRPGDLQISARFGQRGQSLRLDPKEIFEACKAECADYATQASKARGRAPFLLDCARLSVAKSEQVRAFFKLRNKPFAPDLSKLAEKCKAEAARASELEKKREDKRARFGATYGARLLALWRLHAEGSEEAGAIRELGAKLGFRSVSFSPLISSPELAGTAALRLSVERDRVETSQGAQVLVRTVRFLWAFCRNAKATQTPVDRETLARFPRLDNYSANAIDAGGNLTAGCHKIPFAEIEGIARELGLPPFNGEPAEAPTIPAEEVLA